MKNKMMAMLIKKNHCLPKNLRKDLWMLSSGALKTKSNNPEYYSRKVYNKCSKFYGLGHNFNTCDECQSNFEIVYPLYDSYSELADPNIDQIVLDIPRTYTDDDKLANLEEKHDTLKRVLCSYSKRNSNIGYCQGMNCIAANILNIVGSEEDAFWVLAQVIESHLPLDYYSLMLEVLIDQKVLLFLIKKKRSRLLKKFNNIEIDLIMRSFQWFICLFCLNVKQEITEAIWDFFFTEGNIALFKSAIILLEFPMEILNRQTFIKHYSKCNSIKQNLI